MALNILERGSISVHSSSTSIITHQPSTRPRPRGTAAQPPPRNNRPFYSAMKILVPNSNGIRSSSVISIFPCPLLYPRRIHKKHPPKQLLGWRLNQTSMKLSWDSATTGNEGVTGRTGDSSDGWEEGEECVEVIVVGSRKDSLLNFCSASPFLSPALRFWNILGNDSEQVQLQQRLASHGSPPRKLEDFLMWQSSCKAAILVASAAYGSDGITVLEVLSNVKVGNGLVVGVILKPFRFEGQRRQDEVNGLLCKLQKLSSFNIVLDTDALLENDLLTLEEALRTSNNAALMTMNAISILFSEKHKKILNTKDNITSDLLLPELTEILARYSKARVAFGASYNIKASLSRAINDSTFHAVDMKDIDGLILCTIATSGVINCIDTNNVLQTIRLVTNCNGEIIVSIVHELNLEPNTVLATIIFFGCTKKDLAPRNGILDSLGRHFPFIFSIFKNQPWQSSDSENASSPETPYTSDAMSVPAVRDMPNVDILDTADETGVFFDNPQSMEEDTNEEFSCSRDKISFGQSERGLVVAYSSYSTFEMNSEGNPVLKIDQLARGTGYSTEFFKHRTSFSRVDALDGSVSVYKQPVGVKHLKNSEGPLTPKTKIGTSWRIDENEKRQHAGSSMPWTDYFMNEVASVNKDICTANNNKQGGLSVRAASMLESERDTQKKWSRVVGMKYRGGTYRGRIEGGFPEGKGRLLLVDGSIYDGMWRYGKRSGLGTFYFNNGDVFQGSWRDDFMHGKGWIYFHTGDRWFVNFWKGKPNGEGRFYSKLGDVLFGHFKEGWRDGYFLRINVDGTRSKELWDEGVLVSEKQLDPDADAEVG